MQHPLTRGPLRNRYRSGVDSPSAFHHRTMSFDAPAFRLHPNLARICTSLFKRSPVHNTVLTQTFCTVRFHFSKDYPLSGGSVLAVSMFMLLIEPRC